MQTPTIPNLDFWNLLRRQEQQHKDPPPPPKPPEPKPVQTSASDQMAQALAGQQAPAMQGLFGVPHPELQRMAGDVVPIGRTPASGIYQPGALGGALAPNVAGAKAAGTPYIGPPTGSPALGNIAAQDIANGRLMNNPFAFGGRTTTPVR